MRVTRTMHATAYTVAGVPTCLGVAEVEYVVRSDGRFAVVSMVTDRGIGFALPENAEQRQAVRDAEYHCDPSRVIPIASTADDGTNHASLDADWRDEMPQEQRGFKVRADIHSDDFRQRCDFDAAPWMEKASDEEILKLAGCDWGGDYPADDVAYGLEATNQGIADVLKYCCDAHKYGITMGFEVQVHSDDALAWLGEHRPHILDVLAGEPTEAPTQD